MSRAHAVPLILCLVLCLVATSPAQTRRGAAPRPTAPPSGPAPFPEDLATLFPASTAFYVEAADFAGLLGATGVDAEMYERLVAVLKDAKTEKPPFTLAEMRAVLSSRIVVGAVGVGKRDPLPLAVFRASSAETAALFRDRVLPMMYPEQAATTKPVVKTEHGRTITVVGTTSSSLAFSSAGRDIVFGEPSTVSAALAARPASSLASVPAFGEARKRFASRNNLFVFIDAGSFLRSYYLLGSSNDQAQNEYESAIGTRAISSIAFALSSDSGGGLLENLVTIDRSKESLVSVLTDPPPVRLRAASVLPADTHVAVAFGLEPARVHDIVDRRLVPVGKRASGGRPSEFEGLLRYLEAKVQMKLREEFLDSLGDEIVVGFDFSPTGYGMYVPTEALGLPAPRVVTVVEVTNAELARPGLARLFARKAGEATERDDNGVTVTEIGETACAVVDGLAIVGPSDYVARALAAYRSGETLAATKAFTAAKASLPGETVAIGFVSPRLVERFVKKLEQLATMPETDTPLPAPTDRASVAESLLVTTEKYEGGVYTTASLSSQMAVALLGMGAAVAIPTILAARRASFESAAIGNLRTIGSAEATFYAQQGRYGTFADLVATQMLDSGWTNGVVRDGYRITQVRVTKEAFEFKAEPATPSNGTKSYNISEDYVIRYAEGSTAPRGTAGRPIGMPPENHP